jgi:cysteine-rich repeat protein
VIDDAAGDTGTLDAWYLALCVNPTGAHCGDSIRNGSEECDDGNLVDNDSCSNLCQVVDGCGDGNLDAGEDCDDDNLVAGDGCSATCTLDISCGAGEVPVVLTNSTASAVPDDPGGLLSAITVALPGVVRKVIPSLSISHAVDAHLDVFLISPYGVQRELSTDQTGVSYVATSFSDTAATAITAGSAPYTGTFRPEQTISSAAPVGFANQTATGSWNLRVSDDTVGTSGTLNRWSLALCIDPTVASVCGNGIVELSETCDDGNTTGGDGCSSSCAVELSCPFGQTAVITRSNRADIIPDNSLGGFSSTLTVSTSGAVTKTILVIGALSHANDAHLDASLISPAATAIDVSSDNGGTGDDYVSTIFDAAAATSITAGVAPFRGRFQSEATLATLDGQAASGTWTFKVVDDTAADAGVLGAWTLGLCVQDN